MQCNKQPLCETLADTEESSRITQPKPQVPHLLFIFLPTFILPGTTYLPLATRNRETALRESILSYLI